MFEAKLNFKNKCEYEEEGYMCDSCESEQDDNTHVLHCPSYRDLIKGKDLDSDRDLASYLLQVLNIRTTLRLRR